MLVKIGPIITNRYTLNGTSTAPRYAPMLKARPKAAG